jgi:phosphoserine phosphatase
LLTAHRRGGHDVIIVSTSGHEIVVPIAAMLGASQVIASRPQVADGRCSGWSASRTR